MMKSFKTFRVLAAALPLSIACSTMLESDDPADDDLVVGDDKMDTAYYSTLAMELAAEFVGEIREEHESPAAANARAESLRSTTESWTVASLVDNHAKFAMNKVKSDKLHMNLNGNSLSSKDVSVSGRTVTFKYVAKTEVLVQKEDLKKAGIPLSSLNGKSTTVKVPADLRNIAQKLGTRCAEGMDAGDTPQDYNYFYYWKPDKPGCDAPMTDATLKLSSLLPKKTTYPEYNKLTEDGKIEVVVFFGAADHDEVVKESDWGMYNWRTFTRDLTSRGFRKASDQNPGGRYTRTNRGVQVIVDVYGPRDLQAANHDSSGIFAQAIKTHEIILYNGHSFYGSLDVLDKKENYPEGKYQVFMFASCWSYEYYTKQIFENKKSAADPNGWALADVVNNTEVTWFHNDAPASRIVLMNIIAGAESGGKDGTRNYHWGNIIDQMNRQALQAQADHKTDSHEVWGVSGVRENKFRPKR